jgi:hypothetical protein
MVRLLTEDEMKKAAATQCLAKLEEFFTTLSEEDGLRSVYYVDTWDAPPDEDTKCRYILIHTLREAPTPAEEWVCAPKLEGERVTLAMKAAYERISLMPGRADDLTLGFMTGRLLSRKTNG